jgi:hypothetical protein
MTRLSITRRETGLWCLAACVPVIVGLVRFGGPALSEDSYQYMSAAQNLVSGRGIATSILHYDVDLAAGTIPAPLTHWPPGYPIAIALLHVLGVPLEAAAAALSAAAFVALVPILVVGAKKLELGSWPTRLILVWLLTNSWVFVYPVAGTSESLFTALMTAGVVWLLPTPMPERDRLKPWSAVAGSVLVGLAASVRFAGVLVMIALGAYFGWRLLARRDRRSALLLALAVGPAAALTIANALRGAWISGSWQVGHGSETTRDLGALAKPLATSIYHLFFGDAVATRLGPVELALVLAVVVFMATAVWAMRQERRPVTHLVPLEAALLATTVAVYCAGMTAIARSTTITFDSRMFYPILPIALLSLAAVIARLAGQSLYARAGGLASGAALVLATTCYVAINLRCVAVEPGPEPHTVVAQRLAGPLNDWIAAHIPPTAPIMASDGQPTAYVLKRPGISLAYSAFSGTTWSEDAVRDTMARFGVQFLILYPHVDPASDPVQAESPFLSALLLGSTPAWLEVAAENRDTRIYRRR